MSHYDLYRQRQYQRGRQDDDSDRISASFPRRNNSSRNYSNTSALFSMSQRDVFSEETVSDGAVGYPFPRAANDRDTFRQSFVESLDNNSSSRRSESDVNESLHLLISHHHSDNIEEGESFVHNYDNSVLMADQDDSFANDSTSFRGSPYLNKRTTEDDFSDAITVKASSNHTRSVDYTERSSTEFMAPSISTTQTPTSTGFAIGGGRVVEHKPQPQREESSSSEDQSEAQQQQQAMMIAATEPTTTLQQQQQPTDPSHHSEPKSNISVASQTSSNQANIGPPIVDVDLEDFQEFERQVLSGEFEDQEAKQAMHRRRLVLVAAFALFLILLVAAGTFTFWILGIQREEELARSDNPKPPRLVTPAPTMEPTPTQAPTINVNVWAQDFLPTHTLEAAAVPGTPQAQAMYWVQSDPYFIYSNVPPPNDSDNNSSNSTTTRPSETEVISKRQNRFALATIFYAMGGNEQWNQEEGGKSGGGGRWLSDEDECTWPHYTCDAGKLEDEASPQTNVARSSSQNVRQRRQTLQEIRRATLQLKDNVPISGTIPPEVAMLTHLEVLTLYHHNGGHASGLTGLYGPIPTQLGLLTDLTVLDLHNNKLTGTLPTQLGALSKLERVYLHHNLLSATAVPEAWCVLESVVEINVDCGSVACQCGTQCKCVGESGGNNIFDHSATVTAIPIVTNQPENTAVPTLPATPGAITTVSGAVAPASTPPPTTDLVVVVAPTTGSPTGTSASVSPPPSTSVSFSPTPSPQQSTSISLSPTASPQQVGSNSSMTSNNSSDLIVPIPISNDTATLANYTNSSDTTMELQQRKLLCNGLANTCDHPLPEVLIPMVHNGMASRADGFLLPNHLLRVEEAVQAGFRGVNLDVCKCGENNQIVFCHGECFLGTREPYEVFANLAKFLADNPHEVLVFTFQAHNDKEGNPLNLFEFYDIMKQVGSPFTDRIYVHEPGNAWPTLRSLIEEDKRIVMFHFNGPTCDDGPGSCPVGLHYYFDYVAETEFSFSQVDDLLRTELSCRITRGTNGRHRAFFGINNFLRIPQESIASTINALDFVRPRVETCVAANGGIDASFLYVDHWSVGDVLEFVNNHNRQLTPRLSDSAN